MFRLQGGIEVMDTQVVGESEKQVRPAWPSMQQDIRHGSMVCRATCGILCRALRGNGLASSSN